jgi:hypothetical protein
MKRRLAALLSAPLAATPALGQTLTIPASTTTTVSTSTTYSNVSNAGTLRFGANSVGVTVTGAYTGTGGFTTSGGAPAYPAVIDRGLILRSDTVIDPAAAVFQQVWMNFTADGSTVTYNGSIEVGNGSSNPNNRYSFSMKNGGRFVLGPGARMNNNLPDSINARAVFVYSDSNPANVFELDPNFDADISKDFNLADGLSVLRFGGGSATLISHASKSLPTINKLTNTTPPGTTHHGVLSFAHTTADTVRWIVRTNPQSYDGQLSFSQPTRITTERDLTIDGVFHPAVNVAWLSTATVTKDGTARLILSGDQAHKPGSAINVTQGTLDLRTDPGTPVSWDAASGQNLNLTASTGGTVQVNTPLARVSQLNVAGGVVQLPSGASEIRTNTLSMTGGAIEIGLTSATSFDRVTVSGAASLGGEIRVVQTGSYFPLPGEEFDVLGFASQTGEVTAVNQTSKAGLRFGKRYSSSALTLIASGRAGDANLDNEVNFADLLALAQNYELTGRNWLQGDFDLDGTVNFPDLLALAQNYETPATVMADWSLAQSMVPEPTAALVAAAIGATSLSRRRRRV